MEPATTEYHRRPVFLDPSYSAQGFDPPAIHSLGITQIGGLVVPAGDPPSYGEHRAIGTGRRSVPVGLAGGGHDEGARIEFHAAVLLSTDVSPSRDDKEQLPTRVVVPVGHRAIVEVTQRGVGVSLGGGGIEQLQVDRSREGSSRSGAAVTASDHPHDRKPFAE
ncbi:uncharacterized protein METZ01_LOCUS165543 [marine metagenome]|uniref:Uncharacterized protein n=1 Tax=marine metagenome TaxID=408172 RepID=A0A382BGF2_9ZZZZ